MTSGVADTPRPGRPPAVGELAWHTLGADQVLRSEGVDGQHGLSSAEAAARARQFGRNEFTAGRAEPRWHAFFRQYRDPMQLVLLAAGIGSLYPLKQLGTGVLLILLTLFNAVEGLHQEGKATAAVSALQKMVIITARVRRDGQLAEIPAGQLVPGDIVAIEAGDIVPADGRLVTAATLEVDESALTGESLPVAKGTEPVAGTDTPLGDRSDMVYMNTNVTRGAGEFVVTATGMSTQVGQISGLLQEEQATKTPLTRQLDRLTGQILVIAGLALVASMALNLRQRYLAENQRLGEQGLRVIAIARKDFDQAAFNPHADLLPLVTGLELIALVGIVDPPRSASIFNVAEGIPLLPLQTLWVSFTMLSIQSVGLGYSKPAAGLMDRPPLPPAKPILTRGLIVWLAFVGLVMTVGTLSVISWAEQVHGLAVARTMGMVTFALFLLFFSVESKDQRDSAFSLDTFSDKTFVVTTGGSFVLLILSTVLDIFHTVMKTVTLDVRQWLICAAVALSIVVAAEARKAVLRRIAAKVIPPASATGAWPGR